MFIDSIGTIGAILGLISFIPQIWGSYKSKSCGMEMGFILISLVGVACTLAYLFAKDAPIITLFQFSAIEAAFVIIFIQKIIYTGKS